MKIKRFDEFIKEDHNIDRSRKGLSKFNVDKKIKPYSQSDNWFYFRDEEDGDDYHNFYYYGYLMKEGQLEKFITRIGNEEEMNAAEAYLKRNHIPYTINNKEVEFDSKYVDFEGYVKHHPSYA